MQLQKLYSPSLLTVTRGAKGCIALHNGVFFRSQAYRVDCVDTTGSGDSFVAASLYGLIEAGVPASELTGEQLTRILMRANAAGSLTASKRGAVPAMPTLEEIDRCTQTNDRLPD